MNDTHTYNSFAFQSYLSSGTYYLRLYTRNIEDTNIWELILVARRCMKYPEDWISLLYLEDISKRFESSRWTGTSQSKYAVSSQLILFQLDIGNDIETRFSTRQELNTMSNIDDGRFDHKMWIHLIIYPRFISFSKHSIPLHELLYFCSKTSTSGMMRVEGRSCNLSTRYIEAKRFEHTSKETSGNRNWTQEWAYQMMSKWTTPQHSLILQHSLIPIHTSITSDTWSNWLKSDVLSRGSVRIQSRVVTAESYDWLQHQLPIQAAIPVGLNLWHKRILIPQWAQSRPQ